MRREPRRRFTISDALAMIAAIGVGILFAKLDYPIFAPFSRPLAANRPLAAKLWWPILHLLCAFLLPLTWMVVFLRIRSRRPRFRSPGVAACMAVTVSSLSMLLFFSHNIDRAWTSARVWVHALSHIETPMPLAASVAAIWSIFLVDCRWRPESSWIDRTGIALGAFWLAAGLAIPLLNIFVNR